MADLQLLTSPTIGPLLPSPSILTGTFRPQTAAAYLEQSLAEARARLASPSDERRVVIRTPCAPVRLARSPSPPSHGEVQPLPALTPPLRGPETAQPPSESQQPAPEESAHQQSPLQRQPTPQLPAPQPSPQQRLLASLSPSSRRGSFSRTPHLPLRSPLRPSTTQSHRSDTPGSIYIATSTAAARLAGSSAGGSQQGTRPAPHPDAQPHEHHAWLPSLRAPRACDDCSTITHAGTAAPTPTDEEPPSGEGECPDIEDRPASEPTTPRTPTLGPPQRRPATRWVPAASCQDLDARRAALCSASAASAAESLDPPRSLTPSKGGSTAERPPSVGKPATPALSQSQHPLRRSAPAALRPTGRGGSAGALASGGPPMFQHTATKRVLQAADGAAAAAAAAQEASRPGQFRVSRGMVFSVFQELDEFDAGRITYSAFEQAACKIGMRPPQARLLFEQLDPYGRGYTTIQEWSCPQLKRQMDAFTRLYVQATRARDGRPKDVRLIRSVPMAIQMAMLKLQLKRCGRAVSLERLVQAFACMDTDKSGTLSPGEVEDALNALGIFVTPEVIDTIMRTFDKDGNGSVNYYEFVRSIHPTLEQTARPR